MIYLFKKFNGQVILASEATAWDLYTSNGDWKHRPQYLGAVAKAVYLDLKNTLKDNVPINDELVERVNQGDKKADRELKALYAQRDALHKVLTDTLISRADKTITPPNMNIVNKATLPKEYHKMAQALASND